MDTFLAAARDYRVWLLFVTYEIAGRRVYSDWSRWAGRLFNARNEQSDWLEYSDPNAGAYRAALLIDDRIVACVFLSPRQDLPSRTWLSGLFAKDRTGLLMGQATDSRADTGPVVCACFGVGRRTICEAIGKHRLGTPQEVGRKLRAGTNCRIARRSIATIAHLPRIQRCRRICTDS